MSVTNLSDPGTSPPGFATQSPIVVWDPVPDAAAYDVDVAAFVGGVCQYGRPAPLDFGFNTPVPAWSPLAAPKVTPPYPVPHGVSLARDRVALTTGRSYCVRVRAHTDKAISGEDIFGNYTYLPNAFYFEASPPACPCLPKINESDYVHPVFKTERKTERRTPIFTWRAIPGAAAYWVIVARDRSFTTVADYAVTNIPAYVPRFTYADETTSKPYFWAILPMGSTGQAEPDPLLVPIVDFRKLSIPPRFVQPQSRVTGPPTFQWTEAEGARNYRLEVSQDRNFGTLLDGISTDSTAYTATKTYPANSALYARVRAEDVDGIGLAWSSTKQFRDRLATPKVSRGNPAAGDLIPTWIWSHVQGALSYDVHVDLPDGTSRDFSNDLLTAFTATTMTGTGVFRWQVRAEFPEARGSKTAVGPYTRAMTFTRTIRPPKGTGAAVGGRSVLLSWQPKIGAAHYLVQVATSPDFAQTVENTRTDNTSFAPDFRNGRWAQSTTFYWRVATVDADSNSGNYSPVRLFRLHLPSSR